MSSSRSGSSSLSVIAAVVCREKTTANPSPTGERATMLSTCSVRSMNSGAVVVTTSIDSDQQAKPAPGSIAGRGNGFKAMTRELLNEVDRGGESRGRAGAEPQRLVWDWWGEGGLRFGLSIVTQRIVSRLGITAPEARPDHPNGPRTGGSQELDNSDANYHVAVTQAGATSLSGATANGSGGAARGADQTDPPLAWMPEWPGSLA